jgi:hypothetical protein
MVLGSRTATILPRLTFSTFFFASHSLAHCLKGRAATCCACRAAFRCWNSEIRHERLLPRYQQKYQQNGRLQRVQGIGLADLKLRFAEANLRMPLTRRENFLEGKESN